MEETLGKRIAFHRKRLSLTQDALADQLGVTAQAVSKWENDQSCPDISMLPKLAEVFHVTTDELFGLEKQSSTMEVPEREQPQPQPIAKKVCSSSQKFRIGIALWLLIDGGLLILNTLLDWSVTPRYITWSSGLMVFGLLGLYPKFSILRLGCALFGAYWLLWYIDLLPAMLLVAKWEFVIPSALLFFGVCLLLDSLFSPRRDLPLGHRLDGTTENHCTYDGEHFDCVTCFGSGDRQIQLPRLSGGSGRVTFGELIIDISRCAEIADGCPIALECAFGSLEILVPRKYRVEAATGSAFGAVDVKGSPDPDADITIYLNCKVSFGEITIRHI